jgi:hypothetical protein
MRRITLVLSAIFALASILPAQQKDAKQPEPKKEEKKDEKKPPEEKPKPLFEGKTGFKSSRQTTDQATLGFNGVDDNGKVPKDLLEASPSGSDFASAQTLAAHRPGSAELDQFLNEGNLKKK